MRLPDSAHISQPWRIHEHARDFLLEDVWALPTPGGPDDFPRLVAMMASYDPSRASTPIVRALFQLRWRLGGLLGWDGPQRSGSREIASVRARLPEDLRSGAPGPSALIGNFTPVYMTDRECALEIVNRTVHGILHLGWVANGAGGYRGQMAVLVKRDGRLGAAYMAAITPFRHLIVYPLMMRDIERAWRRLPARDGTPG